MHPRLALLSLLLLSGLALAASPYARSPLADDAAAIDRLFERLRVAPDRASALQIQHRIFETWQRSSGNERARELMWLGIISFEQQELDNALLMFDKAVQLAPEWAEAWNQRASVHFFLGDYTASKRDIAQTLAREPRHFGALAGLGHIHFFEGRVLAARIAYHRALQLHPHMSDVISKLAEIEAEP